MLQLIILLCVFCSALTKAEQFLSFPLDKTEIKVLPQRFEYELIDKDRFRVGNMLINANSLDFQITPLAHGSYKLIFKWPAALLTKGEVILKDNAGLAVWQQNLVTKDIKIEKIKSETLVGTAANHPLRTDLASFNTTNFDTASLNRIKLAPFFKFCLHREDSLTRIYLCSKEFYFKHNGRRLVIQNRDSFRPDAFVQVNGRVVGNQGIIFLQSLEDTISMTAQMASGASIIVDTRLKTVDFVDVAKDGDNIYVTARGSEPADDEQVIKRNGDLWTVLLQGARPTLFLKGEGDIPMRQEFVVNGNVRPLSLKIPITNWNSLGTYTESNSVKLEATPEISLKSADKNSQIVKDTDALWAWNVTDLEPGKSNRRYVSVNSSVGEYVGSADFPRGLRNEIQFSLLAPLAILDFKYQRAINPRWSWDIAYLTYPERRALEPNLAVGTAEVLYRLTPGINLKDPSHGVMASVDQFNSDAFSILGFSLGGYLSYAAAEKNRVFYDTLVWRTKIPLGGTGSGFSLAPSIKTDLVLKKQLGEWTWETGARFESYRFTGSNIEVDYNRFSLIFGVSQFF